MPFSIIRNDITRVHADAIVNSGNIEPEIGGGADLAIYRAAGAEQLLAARKKIGRILPGEASATRGFDLPARYVIHTVAPLWEGGGSGEEETLRRCYESCLKIAKKKRLGSIAFPLLASGTLGFPKDKALSAALSAIQQFLMSSEMMVWLVVFDRTSFRLSENLSHDIASFIDDRYVEDRETEEYQSPRRNEAFHSQAASRREQRIREWEHAAMHSAESMPLHPAGSVPSPAAAPVFAAKDAAPLAKAAKKRSIDDVLGELGETFQEKLMRMIKERGYDNKEVYKRANLDRKVFSKIKGNPLYTPKKSTAIALAIALRLNMDEARDLLGRAGYAFSPGSKADLIVEYFIENGVYDVYTIDTALFDHDLPMLSNY